MISKEQIQKAETFATIKIRNKYSGYESFVSNFNKFLVMSFIFKPNEEGHAYFDIAANNGPLKGLIEVLSRKKFDSDMFSLIRIHTINDFDKSLAYYTTRINHEDIFLDKKDEIIKDKHDISETYYAFLITDIVVSGKKRNDDEVAIVGADSDYAKLIYDPIKVDNFKKAINYNQD